MRPTQNIEKLLVTLILIFSVACSEVVTPESNISQTDSAIRNGEEVSGLADLKLKQDLSRLGVKISFNGGICTGILISDQVIMTAGHCVYGHSVADIAVEFEGLNEVYSVTEVLIHEDYFPGTRNTHTDLALMKITEAVPLSLIRVGLPESIPVHESIVLRSIGYGLTHGNLAGTHGSLRTTLFSPLELDPRSPIFLSNQLADTSSGVCMGDSGGPALAEVNGKYYVIGVAQGVYAKKLSPPQLVDRKEYGVFSETFHEKHPDVDICMGWSNFVNVQNALPWIKNGLEQLEALDKN